MGRMAFCRTLLEAPGFVAGFDDVAMMRQPIQQRRSHLGVAEYTRPFREAEVGGDEPAGVLVQLGQQVK